MMKLQIQVRENGTLQFVAPDKGPIVTLDYTELCILSQLARPTQVFVSKWHHAMDELRHLRQGMPAPVDPWDPRFATSVQHLETLGLVQPPRPRQPAQLTQQGKVLMHWLHYSWAGLAAYLRQFPL
jgi:hypothetical protein